VAKTTHRVRLARRAQRRIWQAKQDGVDATAVESIHVNCRSWSTQCASGRSVFPPRP
jgi:hypothetical protein